MPERAKQGSGMMRREVPTLDEGVKLFGPDQAREKNARRVRAELAKAYAQMTPEFFCRNAPRQLDLIREDMASHPEGYVSSYFGEDHAYAIMQQWLNVYDLLAAELAKPDPDPARIAMHAEDCGRLQERLWWRAGVDSDTEEMREVLALREKVATGNRRVGGAANARAAAERRDTAIRLAREIEARRTKPLSRLALARAVREEWPDEELPSIESLRKIVGKA